MSFKLLHRAVVCCLSSASTASANPWTFLFWNILFTVIFLRANSYNGKCSCYYFAIIFILLKYYYLHYFNPIICFDFWDLLFALFLLLHYYFYYIYFLLYQLFLYQGIVSINFIFWYYSLFFSLLLLIHLRINAN